jgi:serine phosphatase RsbU (regulator of sigma subunit)
VSLSSGQVIAEDLGSTNGTFINNARITAPVTLTEGNVLRVGSQFLRYERRSKDDVKRAIELDRDLQKARRYVESLLPPPVADGPLRIDWRFTPSAQLGGDAFGYDWLDKETFAFFLLDVSGHGVGSAMHSVAALSALRQRTLPNVDFSNPADVLASLNARFQMEAHNGMFFTIWYGVYRVRDRRLTYSSAGHHPSYLVPPDRDAVQPLGEPALMVGVMPDVPYDNQTAEIPAGSTLYLFSDGVFEIATVDQHLWNLSDFLPLLQEAPVSGVTHPERLYAAIRRAARPGPFDDDFSLVAVTFM